MKEDNLKIEDEIDELMENAIKFLYDEKIYDVKRCIVQATEIIRRNDSFNAIASFEYLMLLFKKKKSVFMDTRFKDGTKYIDYKDEISHVSFSIDFNNEYKRILNDIIE